MSQFADYKADGHLWITLTTGEYYPDILHDACALYEPVLIMFGQLLRSSETSERLLLTISDTPDSWMRVQMARVFRKYISPETPVEMLKKKSKTQEICAQFGKGFRKIHEAQKAFQSRPIPDEALCALLWEYKDRGKKGYDLTERFFEMFRSRFPDVEITGPERAGKDVLMREVFSDYPHPKRPIDFVIRQGRTVLAIGLARYDGDRGGAQEDDRTGGYMNAASEFFAYTKKKKLSAKIIFLNDGPGLLLGSMWDDYATIERTWQNKVMVLTLRMITERLTKEWLLESQQ
ncbi:MAG: bstEII [Candidatus Kapaibacterium sp.]|nr:MAG: bstEII [Candidatus Kapabacteria bacterium]